MEIANKVNSANDYKVSWNKINKFIKTKGLLEDSRIIECMASLEVHDIPPNVDPPKDYWKHPNMRVIPIYPLVGARWRPMSLVDHG